MAPPSYTSMIKSAIIGLHERNGSTAASCTQYIKQHYPDIEFRSHSLRDALTKGVANGHFIKLKSTYKLALQKKQAAAS
eukprot:14874-Heterococcus_DN1.PRE.10